MVDDNVTLKGFVRSESYKEGEPWKVHTVDTFDYYKEPVKSQLIAKSVRSVPPLGGKIDYDISDRLVGNWFKDGTGKYSGDGSATYWSTHLSIVYDSIDPSQIRISMGDFGGRAEQFGVKGNRPDPASVAVGEITKYEVVPFEYYIHETNSRWDPAKFSNSLKAENLDEIRGVALFKVLPENRLQAEFFPGKTGSDVSGFTDSAEIFER